MQISLQFIPSLNSNNRNVKKSPSADDTHAAHQCERIFTNSPGSHRRDPKKLTLYIVKDTYRFQGMEFKKSMAKVKLNVSKIRYGVSDDVFVLNVNDFPNAVVVRKQANGSAR